MKRTLLTIIIGVSTLLIVTNCSAQRNKMAFPDERWHFSSELNLEDTETADKMYNFIVNEMNTTGLLIVKSGEVIGSFGDIDELSYLASCRKSILLSSAIRLGLIGYSLSCYFCASRGSDLAEYWNIFDSDSSGLGGYKSIAKPNIGAELPPAIRLPKWLTIRKVLHVRVYYLSK